MRQAGQAAQGRAVAQDASEHYRE